LFPLLTGSDFDELKADIGKNGLLESIWLHTDGSIIDGRNRHRACIETETEPRFRTWGGQGSLVAFVVSLNLHRRHLTSSQRAVIALEVLPMLEKEAEARMVAGVAPDPTELFPQGESREQAAEMFQTNSNYVQAAKTIKEQAPDLLESVKVGKITIPQAKRELVKRQRKDASPVPPPTGKYRVIYADPPWSYSNSGFDQSAASQYPTMPIEDICALPIGDLADENCVLFLWATSPLLPEAIRVVSSWGFEYKASRVWIKNRAPGMGWFVRTRHELLLIAVRGHAHPKEKIDSVFQAEISRHSAKPTLVYDDIERCYDGPYIELFARNERDGWKSWGNEI